MNNDSQQRFASIARQVLALAAVVMGALTAALKGIHLPTAVAAILAAGGLLLFNVEHYLGDPSTGTTPTPTVTDVAKAQAVIDAFSAATKPATVIVPAPPPVQS